MILSGAYLPAGVSFGRETTLVIQGINPPPAYPICEAIEPHVRRDNALDSDTQKIVLEDADEMIDRKGKEKMPNLKNHEANPASAPMVSGELAMPPRAATETPTAMDDEGSSAAGQRSIKANRLERLSF